MMFILIIKQKIGENSSSFFNFRGSYDLHFNQLGYADPNVDKMKVPWTPLDPTIMIPYHTLNGRIPLTFDPPGKSSASVG